MSSPQTSGAHAAWRTAGPGRPRAHAALAAGAAAAALWSAAAASTGERILHVSPSPLETVPDEWEYRSISAAAAVVKPAGRVMIHSGIYRESVRIQASGTQEQPIRFEAAPFAQVVVTGADRLGNWTKDSGSEQDARVYHSAWPHRFVTWSESMTHPSDREHLLIGRAEQVFADGYPLRQVLERRWLSRGTFFADTVNARLTIWTANDRELDDETCVEASVRPVLWDCAGDFVHLHGLRFRYAANAAQQAAVQFRGRGNVVEDCIFERMNSIGAGFLGPDQVARRCTFQDNGQLGWSAVEAHRLRMEESTTRNNNTKGFARQWEAGGNKIVLTREAVLDSCQFLGNRGHGLWFDIGNEQATVRNCLLAQNEGAGIFYEISYGLHAHDNVVVGNGLANRPGDWGAAAGVAISSSPECIVERNLLIGNREGIAFREQSRTTRRIDHSGSEVPVWNRDQIIRANFLAGNIEAQVRGWFDVDDERHWPAVRQERPAAAGLSLEKLNITCNGNVYGSGSRPMVHWGVSWKRNKPYPTLESLRRELGFERDGAVTPLEFTNSAALDFRLPAGSSVLVRRAYPQGQVPGTLLGAPDFTQPASP